MDNRISSYETMFIVDLKGGEDAVKATVEKFKSLIEANGTIDSVNEIGKKRLAYPINDTVEGYYVLITFKAVTSFTTELERIFKLTEEVMRSMVIKL